MLLLIPGTCLYCITKANSLIYTASHALAAWDRSNTMSDEQVSISLYHSGRRQSDSSSKVQTYFYCSRVTLLCNLALQQNT